MCGIVGLIDYASSAIDPAVVAKAVDVLQARGPDDRGVWVEDGAALGHRRLAVMDPTPAGHQPMKSTDGRYVIVFNGEIYNFRELRKDLNGSGQHWKSGTDTEVILASYAKWGTDCLLRFHGMFALAIWDRRERVLFVARDRMGVKPFYYHASENQFAFGSRPSALFPLSGRISAQFDEQALRLYLELGYTPSQFTYYRDIRKLPPAHFAIFDKQGLTLKRYWDYRNISTEPSWSRRAESDLLDELDTILTNSVRSRMISDVPLGAFLSGGIDSSVVVALMKKCSSAPVKTFTIGFNEPKYDESGHAKAVADHLGTDHYCEMLNVDDLLELMPTFWKEYDDPFFDCSAIPTMAVSRLARSHVTVSLTGDGGDELFGGYHYYKIAQQLGPFYAIPKELRGVAASLAGMFPGHRMKLLSGALHQRSSLRAFAFSRSISKDYDSLLHPDLLARTSGIQDIFSASAAEFSDGLSTAEQAMRLDAALTLPDDYLQKVDVASMAFSLESREPLLDHSLVEWAMRLPTRWKMRGRQGKYLLRKLAYRYVPRTILERPKQGFGVPIDAWLRGPLKDWARSRIDDPELYLRVPIVQKKLQGLFELHLSGTRNVHPLLWAALVLLDFSTRGPSA